MSILSIIDKTPDKDLECVCGVYGLGVGTRIENACRLYKWADTIKKQIKLIEDLQLCLEGDILGSPIFY